MRLLPSALCVSTLALTSMAWAQRRPCHDFAPASQRVQALVQRLQLPGASLALAKRDGVTRTEHFGSYGNDTVVPIASASKLVSGVVLMTLVDAQKLSLDDPVGKFLPSFTGTKGTITIRQLFSHTSGLPGSNIALSAKNLTLAQAVDHIGNNVALRAQPGAEFYYGGVSMHVAGRVCEVVSGQDWEKLVTDNLLTPLGITTLDYQGLGATTNYRISGSVQCRIEDYVRILRMLVQGGRYGTTRVLSEAAVQTMCSDQTRGAKIVSTPQPDARRYGIGVWLDRVDNGRVLQVSSQGAFGFSPWVDFERELLGVLMIRDQLRNAYADVDELQKWSRSEFALAGAACFGEETALGAKRLRLLPSNEVRAGQAAFALSATGAPALATGLALLGAAHAGQDLFGVRVHLAFAPPPIVLVLLADAQGGASIPLALPKSARGAGIAAQCVWLDQARFGTTPGLQLSVR